MPTQADLQAAFDTAKAAFAETGSRSGTPQYAAFNAAFNNLNAYQAPPSNPLMMSQPQAAAANPISITAAAPPPAYSASPATPSNPLIASQPQSAPTAPPIIYGSSAGRNQGITELYRNYLGRDPSAGDLSYWGSDTQGPLSSIEDNIIRSAEYQTRNTGAQSRGFSSGAIYTDNMFDDNNRVGDTPSSWGYRPATATAPPVFVGAQQTSLTGGSAVDRNEWNLVNSPGYAHLPGNIHYAGPQPGMLPPPGASPPNPLLPLPPRTTAPVMGHNNPPPGPLPTATLGPRTPDTAPLTTQPPTRFAAEYPYPSPTNRQVAAANDQRATPMTQPVGFASNNPLLSRFGTARLGEYTGARETPGNVPPPWTPTTNPLPGIINGGGANGPAVVAESGQQPPEAPRTIAGVPVETIVPLAGAALSLVGLTGDSLIRAAAAIPGGIQLMTGLGITASNTAGYEMGPNGRLVRSGSGLPTPTSTSFAENFNAALKPGWLNTASAGIAALPDILNGDYTQGIGAGLGSYIGSAGGTAAGAGLGGVLGNFVIPGLGSIVGAYIGRKVGGLFGPGGSVGPNAGGYMAFDPATGLLSGGVSDNDNKGGEQEAFVDKFMDGVATVVNEANAQTGGKYVGAYNNARPPAYVEVLQGKINIYDENGVKRAFEGNQVEDAFKHAVDVSTRHSALQLPG